MNTKINILDGALASRSWKSLWSGTAVIVSLALAGPAAHAQGLSGKGDMFLNKQAASHATKGWSSVIIQLNAELTPERENQLKALKVDVTRRLPIINSVAARVPARNLDKLAALPFVKRLSADLKVKKSDEFTAGHTGADAAAVTYPGLDGNGMSIAIVDSGIGQNRDVSGRVVAAANFVSRADAAENTTNDLCGHGTHVAGIAAGNGYGSSKAAYYRTFTGVAPAANLVNARVLDRTGQGTVSEVLAGIQWVIEHKAQYNIRVMNLSLGHAVGESYTTDPLCQSVEKAWQAGIFVVCAAGNNGRQSDVAIPGLDNEGFGTAYGSIQSPGNDPFVITVGAMKQDLSTAAPGTYTGARSADKIATYSSRGPSRIDFVMKPDIVAPGNKIISTLAGDCYVSQNYSSTNEVMINEYKRVGTTTAVSSRYFRMSGTSMAAPVVAGAAALLLEKDPTLTPDALKARLMISADKLVGPNGKADPCTYGAGYLNIPAALGNTAVPTMAAKSPSLSRDARGSVFVDANLVIWGTDAKGSLVIWGVSGVNNLLVIWGTQVLWGTSTNVLDASQILWGTSVWNDLVIWGTGSSSVDLTSTAIRGE